MERKEIGRFYAIAFNETVYEFIVYEDGIACPTLNAEKVKRVILKPRFELIGYENMGYSMPVAGGDKAGLIKTYNIDDELFKYLKLKGRIMYSTDMAYLYGFNNKMGYDSEFKKNPFKRVKAKEKILTRQKQGIYN